MARISKSVTTVVSGATTITKNNAVTLFSTAIDLSTAIALALQLRYVWTSAPTAGKRLKVYLAFSDDGTNYDTSAIETLFKVGDIPLDADTNAQQITIPLDGASIGSKYAKVAVSTDEASYDGSMTSLKAIVTSAT
jgi:hypothetical protein